MSCTKIFCIPILIVMIGFAFSCGKEGRITISGRAIKGPISGAKVRVMNIGGPGKKGELVELLGEAVTDDKGYFQVMLKDDFGGGIVAIRIENGSFVDEATGERVTQSLTTPNNESISYPLSLMKDLSKDHAVPNLGITPLTDFAAVKARLDVEGGMDPKEALDKAMTLVTRYFGLPQDFDQIIPLDLTEQNQADISQVPARYGLILAAFAQMAKELSDTYDTKLEVLMLVNNMLLDFAEDGKFDGQSSLGTIPWVTKKDGTDVNLTADQLKGRFATAMTRFLESSKNRSGITAAAAEQFISHFKNP